jgi:virginiamycin B lyase
MANLECKYRASVLIFCLTLSAPSWSTDGVIYGTITADGQPVRGAMVTAASTLSKITTTVFASADGNYRIDRLAVGDYVVSVKVPGKIVAPQDASINGGQPGRHDFAVLNDPAFIKNLASSHWLELLPDGDMRREFILNCASCHEIPHDRIMLNGAPRTTAEWAAAIALMRSIDVYGLTPPDFNDADYAAWLAKNLSAETIASLKPESPVSGDVLGARYTEYPVAQTPSLPHDLAIGPDGRVWVTAFYNNVIWALDPDSGETTSFAVNETPDVMGQVRALSFDSNGMLWVLLGGTQSVVRLNPNDGSIETFPVGMYPHSIEVDSTGKLWFNDYISDQERIGSIDPTSGELSLYKLPSANLTKQQGLPLLYGLLIDKSDVVWGTMLAANKIFRFDTNDKSAKLFDMPQSNSGPRRPGIGPDGSIWIPEFNTGFVTRFDPKTETFERHSFGSATIGIYDVAVDQRSGDVWAGASLGSAMIRLDAKTGKTVSYPFPTEPGYPRHIAIDPKSGDVWTTLSSMPDAEPKIVRLQLLAE